MEQMDIKKLWNILCLLLVANIAFGAQVTGKVIDKGTMKAIDFANVSIMQGEQLVTGTITDATGAFTLELKDGEYTLVVSFMGYTEQRKPITVAGKPLNTGRIALKEDSRMLNEVEVVGQGSSMRFELDKKVFTVDQNIASAGASVTDVLENIPSVDVDQEAFFVFFPVPGLIKGGEDPLNIRPFPSGGMSATLHSPFKSGMVYRLEKVVDTSGLESLDGVVVVGGSHHDISLHFYLPEYLKAFSVR